MDGWIMAETAGDILKDQDPESDSPMCVFSTLPGVVFQADSLCFSLPENVQDMFKYFKVQL